MNPSLSMRTGVALLLSLLGLPIAVATASAAPSVNPLDLCATTGTMSLPGQPSVTIWGYAPGDCSDDPAVTKPGGPVLEYAQGTSVQVNLYNDLTVATGLSFPGVPMPSDTVGAAAYSGAGARPSKSYTFTVAKPGTFLYEAALLPHAQYQVAMGLYGAMKVLPATAGQAYLDLSPTTGQDSRFTTESTLVLSEIDPALNNASNPAAFNLRNFAPRYGLINGEVHGNTPAMSPILAAGGDKVLLRYVNAGLKLHSMAALGVRQTVVANDGNQLRYPHAIVAETFGPGQTADVIATLPTTNPAKYAIYDGSLSIHNSTSGVGGMLTFITVGVPGAPATTPTTTGVTLTPNPTNGAGDVAVAATVTSASPVTAEYYIDSTSSTPVPMTVSGSAASGTIPSSVLAGLSAGTHVIYVHGTNASGPGSFTSAALNLDKAGPITGSLALTPSVTNSAVVTLTGTGNDTTKGGAIVASATYSIDGGTAVAMQRTLAGPATSPITAFTAPITTSGLAEGAHPVEMQSTDALGNTGAAATITLTIDRLGPGVAVAAWLTPSGPNNGTIGVSSGVPAVRVRATFTDASSTVAGAEGFIDVAGSNGSGFVFTPTDGVWGGLSGSTDAVFADIPLATVAALSNGNHTIFVHAKDAAGNWGITSSAILVIDKQGPVTSVVTATPPASNNTAVVIGATADDSATGGSNIAGGELFIDIAGANGTGIAMTGSGASPVGISGTIPAATVAALSAGNHTIRVHSKDVAGNWGALVNGTVLIDRTAPTFSGITLTPSTIISGTASVALTLNGATDPLVGGLSSGVAGGEYWFGSTNITPGTGTSFSGTSGLSVSTASLAPGTYTVRVRIRDVAGNWSVSPNSGVRTATLRVIPDLIFSDGFESPTTLPGNWSSRSTANTTRLNNTTTSALVDSRGMQAQGNNTNYVQRNFGTTANPATGTYDAKFSFNPNGNTGTNADIFVARTTGGNTVFRVRYRWNGGAPEVQIQVGTGTANAAWTSITNGTANTIEVVWQSGGTLELYVNGTTSSQSLTATVNSVGGVRLGAVTSGGNATLMYFDAFASKRTVTPLLP